MKITLKAARVNCGMTQTEAANLIKVNPATLSKWEKGITFPKADQAARLCAIYGVTIDDIFFKL